MKLILNLIFSLSIISNASTIAFVSLYNDQWKIFLCKEQKCEIISTKMEVKSFDYNFLNNNIVYSASDETIRTIINGYESIILKNDKDAYIEPSFINNGQNIMLVQLLNKHSKKTKIITTNLNGKNYTLLHDENSTILEPYLYNDLLYYSKASCLNNCSYVKQDIWVKNLNTDLKKQLTNLNTVSLQSNSNNKSLYFSSLNNNGYHVYKLEHSNFNIKQITFGDVVDSFPIAYSDGVIFIRKLNKTYNIIKLTSNNNFKVLNFNKIFNKIRNIKAK